MAHQTLIKRADGHGWMGSPSDHILTGPHNPQWLQIRTAFPCYGDTNGQMSRVSMRGIPCANLNWANNNGLMINTMFAVGITENNGKSKGSNVNGQMSHTSESDITV